MAIDWLLLRPGNPVVGNYEIHPQAVSDTRAAQRGRSLTPITLVIMNRGTGVDCQEPLLHVLKFNPSS